MLEEVLMSRHIENVAFSIGDLIFHFKTYFEYEDNLWVGYCLELDLVIASEGYANTRQDLHDVIKAHIEFAIDNNNLHYAYHSAPQEVWDAYIKVVRGRL
jgi:predicted RNase H-like HicB family nuclease